MDGSLEATLRDRSRPATFPTAEVPTAILPTAALPAPTLPTAGDAAPWPMSRDDLVRAAFDTTAALVLVVDAAGHPLLVNGALLHATGWTEAELTGRPFWDTLVAPEDLAGAQDHVRRGDPRGRRLPAGR